MTWTKTLAAWGALALGAQEPVYFKEPELPWWKPQGVLLLEVERLPSLDDDFVQNATRERALLELAWVRPWSCFTGEVALRGALGSDGNRFNLARYDQRPSNGAWLQRALLRADFRAPRGSASITVGLQGNPLLSQESLWDHDLTLAGLGGGAAYRDEAKGIRELGVRVVAGRVRTFPRQAVDLRAAQAVLKVETGPVDWFVHLDRWEIRWDRGDERFEALPGAWATVRQSLRLDTLGLGASSLGGLPWELRGCVHRNAATGETGGEWQAWLGPIAHPFRPRLGHVYQRLSATGTAFATGSDDWWFVGASRGTRWVVQLPLRHRLRLTLSHLLHRTDFSPRTSRRTGLALEWRF
jgi:hypothetical protein